jgi:hypothetical protein
MFNILGVPAQQLQSFNSTRFGAVLLSALSFLFFCHPERSRKAFLQKQKRMPLPSLTQTNYCSLEIQLSKNLTIQFETLSS